MRAIRSVNFAVRGVTLIELLVVMAVIGLLISVFSISLGAGNKPESVLDRVYEQLHQQALIGRDQAVLGSQPLGLLLFPPEDEKEWELQWLRFQGGVWHLAEQPLTSIKLETGVIPQLIVEGESISVEQLRKSAQSGRPGIVFYPSGEVTAFEMRLDWQGQGLTSGSGEKVSVPYRVISSESFTGILL